MPVLLMKTCIRKFITRNIIKHVARIRATPISEVSSELTFQNPAVSNLRNRVPVGGGIVFFPSTKTMRQPFSGTAERIFMKLSPNDRVGCSLKRRAAAWRKSCRRLANGEC